MSKESAHDTNTTKSNHNDVIIMVADEENAATAAPVPPPVVKPAVVVAAGGGTGPKLNKDGTERKKREPKKAKQPNPASNAQHNKQQPTKEQLDAQRNAMRETLKQLKEKRVLLVGGEEGEGEEGAFEIESVYDLALGLELWLRDNSKVSAC
jgi:transcriptional regulator of acetoin/glycerol metabolism